MKVLHIIPDLNQSYGGPAAAILGAAREQHHQGLSVSIVTAVRPASHLDLPSPVKVDAFPHSAAGWFVNKTVRDGLSSIIKTADLVHIHTFWQPIVFWGARCCKILKKPYILRPCGMLDSWSLRQKRIKKNVYLWTVGRFILRGAAAVHLTTAGEAQHSRWIPKHTPRFICPLGIDVAPEVRHNPAHEHQIIPAEFKTKKIILFLGRLHYKKQVHLLINAISQAFINRDDVALMLAGDGESAYVKQLQQLVNRLGLNQKVFFSGFLDSQCKWIAYKAASLFVLPSLQENFGLSIVEAMSVGCPVLVSDRIDLAEDIVRYQAGFVSRLTVQDFAESMKKILDDRVVARTAANNATELLKSRFTWNKIIPELNHVYDDVLKGVQTSHAWVSPTS